MADQQRRAIGGSCLGGVLGGVLGILLGASIAGALEDARLDRVKKERETRIEKEGSHPFGPVVEVMTRSFWVGLAQLLGAGVGGVIGAIAGATIGAAVVAKRSRSLASEAHLPSPPPPASGQLATAPPPPVEESTEAELARVKERLEELERRKQGSATQRKQNEGAFPGTSPGDRE